MEKLKEVQKEKMEREEDNEQQEIEVIRETRGGGHGEVGRG